MSRRQLLLELRHAAPCVLPSLLLCDFGDLRGELARLEEAGVRALHLDVMDGQFVPNLTYGMPIVEGARKWSKLPLDVHLMVARPERFLQAFYDAGADGVTIHVEATGDPASVLAEIRRLGMAAGLALNPQTPLDRVLPCLELCDLVLVMSVEAGFGGQAFDDVALDKLRSLQEAGADLLLQVDGGVNTATIGRCAAAGAQWFVVGSGIFRRDNYTQAVAELERLAASEVST